MLWLFSRSAPVLPVVISDATSASTHSTILARSIWCSKTIWNALLWLVVCILNVASSLLAFIASSFQYLAGAIDGLRVVVPSPETDKFNGRATPGSLNPASDAILPSIIPPEPALIATRPRVYIPESYSRSNAPLAAPSALLSFPQPPIPALPSPSVYDTNSSLRLAAACQAVFDNYTNLKHAHNMATILVTLDKTPIGHIIVPTKFAPVFMSFAVPRPALIESPFATTPNRAHDLETPVQYVTDDLTQSSIPSIRCDSPSDDSSANASGPNDDSFLSETSAVNTSADTSMFDTVSLDKRSYLQLESDLFSEFKRVNSVRSANSLIIDWPPSDSFNYLIEPPPLDGVRPLAVRRKFKVAPGDVAHSPTHSIQEPYFYEAPTIDTPTELKRGGVHCDIDHSPEVPQILEGAEAYRLYQTSYQAWETRFLARLNC